MSVHTDWVLVICLLLSFLDQGQTESDVGMMSVQIGLPPPHQTVKYLYHHTDINTITQTRAE